MAEIEISINNSSGAPEKDLRAVLGNFEKQHGAKILCTVYDWGHAWAETMKIVLYNHGPVISQVGTTWMGSLESTQAIRPFSQGEINRLGGASVFHPASWKSGVSIESGGLMAVPWFIDTYLLYYRKDLLAKAGIDETRAFESFDALAETIQKLAESGVSIPFAMPTIQSSRASLHHMAGWVWSHGGDFVSENGKQLLLSDPDTRKGLKSYFSMYKYMPQAARNLTDADCVVVFLDGSAAISLCNASLIFTALHDPAFAGQTGNLGVAAMPGISFVGGSNLVVWSHIRPAVERLAIDLLCELTSPEAQYAYFEQTGILPTRIEALKKMEEKPLYAPVVRAVLTGRSFRKLKLWGLIEDRLSGTIGQIWQALYAKENASIEEEIARVFDPIERRLQLTLSDN